MLDAANSASTTMTAAAMEAPQWCTTTPVAVAAEVAEVAAQGATQDVATTIVVININIMFATIIAMM